MKKIYILLFLWLLIFSHTAKTEASTLKVPEDFQTIQSAINSAQNGDTIILSPGIYTENIIINKTITLASLYYSTKNPSYIEQTIIDGGGITIGNKVIEIKSPAGPETTITGLTIQNADDGIMPYVPFTLSHSLIRNTRDGLDYEGGGGFAFDNIFEDNGDDGIDFDGTTGAVIERNLIRNNGDDGIEIRLHKMKDNMPKQFITIRDNQITGNEEDGIQLISYDIETAREFKIERNLIANNAMAAIGFMNNQDSLEDYRAASIPEKIYIFQNTIIGHTHGISGGGNVLAVGNIISGTSMLGLKNVNGNSLVANSLLWNAPHLGSNLKSDSIINLNPNLDNNYLLTGSSPAINKSAAQILWLGENINITSVFSGPAPDIGWKEFDAVLTVSPTHTTSPTTPSFLLGDINKDGVVNIIDFNLLSNTFGTNNSASDINKDGIVNIQDYTILSNNFGKSG